MKQSPWLKLDARIGSVFKWTVLMVWSSFYGSAADWIQWRGNALNGIANGSPMLMNAAAVSLNLVLKTPLGSGYSCVSVKGDIAVTMATQEKSDFVLAYHAEKGHLLWRYRLEEFFIGQGGADDGPLSTPTIDGDRVYAVSARGRLVALALSTGKEIWSKDLKTQFDGHPSSYGYSTVPVVSGTKVMVAVGGSEKRSLAAFDRLDGKLQWTVGVEDRIIFQNPLVLKLLGKTQCIVPSLKKVFGVDPQKGSLLWEVALEGYHSDTQVLAVGENRFLLASESNLQLFEISSAASGYDVKLVWKSRAMKNSHGAPVLLGEYLYGFNGSFLSCAKLSDGKAVWKTRKPGGQNLIAVGDSLAFWDHSGSLVLAKAQPEGYAEQARLKLSDQTQNYVPPSFANGKFYLRDFEHLFVVSMKPSARKQIAGTDQPKPFGIMAKLHGDLATGNPEKVLERFKAAHPQWPIKDRSGWIHFLYEGDVEDIAILGDMTGNFLSENLYPIPGTSLYYRSYQMEAGNRWEYLFSIYEDFLIDSKNPQQIQTPRGPKSVISHSDWRGFQPKVRLKDAQKGKLFPVKIDIPDREEAAEVQVYLPPGHQPKGPAIPFVMVSFGKQALEFGKYKDVLDHRYQRTGKPLAAVFLGLPENFWYSANAESTAEFLEKQVLPKISQAFSLSNKREERALIAPSWSSQNVMRFLVTRGQSFGKAGFQGPFFETNYRRNFLDPHIGKLPKTEFVFRWGRYDFFVADSPIDTATESHTNVAYLKGKGHQATGKMHPGGSGWIVWQTDLDALLDQLSL